MPKTLHSEIDVESAPDSFWDLGFVIPSSLGVSSFVIDQPSRVGTAHHG
jgi:hypothetical protein